MTGTNDPPRDKRGFVPWEAIEINEEDEERLKLRRALEALQAEEDEELS